MRSLVVGAMLLHTMNAQGLTGLPAAPAAPAAALPAAALPVAALPAAALPALPARPAAALPAAALPAAALPAAALPAAALPAVPVLPALPALPSTAIPAVGRPTIDRPTVAAPAGIFPALGLPALNASAVNAPAPLLIPGIGAPTEEELLGPLPSIAIPTGLVPSGILPTGTADVIVDQLASALASPSLPDVLSSAAAAIVSPLAAAGGLNPLGPLSPPQAIPLRPVSLPALPTALPGSAIQLPAPLNLGLPVRPRPQVPQVPDVVSAVASNLPGVVSAVASNLAGAITGLPRPRPSIVPGGFGVLAVDEPVDAVTPVETVPVEEVGSPLAAAPVETALADPVISQAQPPAALALPLGVNPFANNPYGPYGPNSIFDPTSPYYDPTAAAALGLGGEDNGIYDGEDYYYKDNKRPVYGGDDEECPSWCLKEYSYPSKEDSYPSKEDSYPSKEDSYPSKEGSYPSKEDSYPSKYEPTPEYSPYPKGYPTPTPEYEPYSQESEYYPEPEVDYPKMRKGRAVRRQIQPYPQPYDSGAYDGEGSDIPDWLYELDGAPQRPTQSKPKCPKSCYKPKPPTYDYDYDTKPTYTKTRKGGYETKKEGYYTTTDDSYYTTTDDSYYTTTDDSYYTTTTDDSYYTTTTDDGYYPDKTTDVPYPDYSSSAWYPKGNSSVPYWPTSIPDSSTEVPYEPTDVPYEPTDVPYEPTDVPYEPTYVPYEPTTLVTQYQAQPYPEQTGGASYESGSGKGDYTGDSLAELCPNVCNPFNPAENFCDITTGCTTTGGSKYYCACRAGYRADGYNAKDFSKQFKVAGQPYVYLAVSTSCNTLCSDNTCSEVMERPHCK